MLTHYRRIRDTGRLTFYIMYGYDMLLPKGMEPM